MSIETNITLATIRRRFLAKIFEQHATTTTIDALGIGRHRLNALCILLLTVLIYTGRQYDVFSIFATLGVADIGHLFAWNEIDEVALRQRLQNVVTLGLGNASLLGYDALVNVAIVGKQSAVIAQKTDDNLVLIRRQLI